MVCKDWNRVIQDPSMWQVGWGCADPQHAGVAFEANCACRICKFPRTRQQASYNRWRGKYGCAQNVLKRDGLVGS